ncbi:MAG TPA: hypothetical protein VEL51_14470 [Vicinamibacterales bacterium]|nr:hypothetical protein [Vicinamibacterales bacterium]
MAASRPLTPKEDRALARSCLDTLSAYRAAVAKGKVSAALKTDARRAFIHLGGDPARPTYSLKDYDHHRYGPFLGVSDEGSAAGAIREAGMESPKARALPRGALKTPLAIGLALDAERLGGVGEVAVGQEEYANIWLECADRVLVTTNVGTRVNVRVYRREPRVLLKSGESAPIEAAKNEIAAAFKPFVETPDKQPRPLTVLVDIPRYVDMAVDAKRAALAELGRFVSSGAAAGLRCAPAGQVLGLTAWVRSGPAGQQEASDAIDLASSAGLQLLVLDGVKRKDADAAISLAGLLDYFAPGLVGPLLREAKEKGVVIRAANLPDTDTIARSIWVGLTTARNMGANLGKYGCFPLTLAEIDHVVEQVQSWLPEWSAAPVFFVDQGLMRAGFVDVEHDLPRGIKVWLDTVASHGVRVVLIDTVDKATGRRLLKKDASDKGGYLTAGQIEGIEQHARKVGIKALWAGGFHLRDAYALGRLGVFGIYVTSAAATTIPVAGSYVRDPALAGVKEPSKEAVLRTKILLEAGFLSSHLNGDVSEALDRAAAALLTELDASKPNPKAIGAASAALARLCVDGWRLHWKR